jgi:hypothetical protein
LGKNRCLFEVAISLELPPFHRFKLVLVLFHSPHYQWQASGDLDANKVELVPVVRRLLQGTKSFLDSAVRAQEKFKTLNGAHNDRFQETRAYHLQSHPSMPDSIFPSTFPLQFSQSPLSTLNS